MIPDVLGSTPDMAESLFAFLHGSTPEKLAILNLAGVSWIHPYGAVALFEVCRYFHRLFQKRIHLTGLRTPIHAYLRRIDFFERGKDVVYTSEPFSTKDDMNRSLSSSNMLEISPICASHQIYDVTTRAQRILTCWLGQTHADIGRIVTLISETCSNAVDHSGDKGVITIQKYEQKYFTEVMLGIGDIGQGIQQSLMAAHGSIAPTCVGYIQKALAGFTARPNKRGGLGLGRIRDIAVESGGNLYIRSETGSVYISSSGTIVKENLFSFPGTQISITFQSKRRD